MRTFREFLKNEYSAYDVGMAAIGKTPLTGDQEGQLGRLFKATKLATSKYPAAVMTLLRRLAKQDPEIQTEIDGIDETGLGKLRMAANKGLNNMDDEEEKVVRNPADGLGVI